MLTGAIIEEHRGHLTNQKKGIYKGLCRSPNLTLLFYGRRHWRWFLCVPDSVSGRVGTIIPSHAFLWFLPWAELYSRGWEYKINEDGYRIGNVGLGWLTVLRETPGGQCDHPKHATQWGRDRAQRTTSSSHSIYATSSLPFQDACWKTMAQWDSSFEWA